MNHPEEVKALMLGESQKAELVTESSIQHTPRPTETPWHIGENNPRWLYDQKGQFVAETYSNFRETSTDNANAELICRAVNSHEALVSALRGLSQMYVHAWDKVDGGLMMMGENSINKYEQAHAKAEKVLASVSPKEKAIK